MSTPLRLPTPPIYGRMTLVVILSLLALVVDMMTPIGIAIGMLYILPLLLTVTQENLHICLSAAIFGTILIIVGYWASPISGEKWVAIINRLMAISQVWVTYFVVRQSMLASSSLKSLHHQFQIETEKTNKQLQDKHTATLNILEDVEQAKNDLKESEARNRHIIESSPIGMIMINQDGKIILANRVLEREFGYEQGELLDQTIEHLVPTQFRAEHSVHRHGFMVNPEPRTMGGNRELFGLRKDGSEFPIEIGLNPLTTDEGICVLASVIDITTRKKQEAIVHQYVKELQRTNEDLNDFAYIASHDLKEPLRGIFNYSTILLEDYGSKLTDDAQAKCQTLLRLSKRMENLIDSLFQFSRAGRTELSTEPIDLQHSLDEVLESLEFRLKECGVMVRIPRRLPTVACDRVQVGEIFRNLITNAMKYNDKAEKWIEIGFVSSGDFDSEALSVKCEAQDGKDTHAESSYEIQDTNNEIPIFYVRDNGIGIREKDLPNIFRIFKRLHGRDKFGGGTGAGLSITKKLIERHGGNVWVESTYGEGTTFFFTLEGSVRDGIHAKTAYSIS